MLDWMLMPLRRYADFKGRSRRKEYWSFVLLNILIYVVLGALMIGGGLPLATLSDPNADPEAMMAAIGPLFWVGGGLLGIWALAIIIPSIAVVVRRLHDRDLSGWWYLGVIVAAFIPFVGFIAQIALFVITLLPGTPGPNRFGPDPKDPLNVGVFS